jgi:hypothetical protein
MDTRKLHAAIGVSLVACLLSVRPAAAQVSVDLTGWQAESYPAVAGFGAGIWNVAPGGGSVFQSVNGQPTFFVSPFQAFNLQLEGQVSCSGAGDDDFFGFALGFSPGESTNPAADYLLIDWKKGTQFFNFGAPSCTAGANAPVGLAVSRVFGIPTADEFWGHDNLDTAPCSTSADGLVELARGATKGAVGWVNNAVYTFRFSLTATLLQVWVDDVLELSVPGLYTNGGFAFYNFSQQNVTYSAYTTQCIADWSSYGFGYGGTAGVPSFSLSANPVLGQPFDFLLGGVNAAPTTAYLVYGFTPAITPLGGPYLWVEPFDVLTLPLATGVNAVPFVAPSDPAWCGVALYGQFAHVDASSSFGLAFSSGLEVVFGL